MRRRESTAAVVVVGDDVDRRQERFAGAGDDGRHRASQGVHWSTADRVGVPTSTRPSTRRSESAWTASGSVRPSASSGRRPCSCSTGRRPSRSSTYQGLDRSSMIDADRPGAPLGEAARHRVGPVPELGDGLEHGLPLLVAHVGRVLQHQRHQRLRDAGAGGNGADRRGTVADRCQPRRLSALVVIPTVRPSSLAAALRNRQRTGDHLDKSNGLESGGRERRDRSLDRSGKLKVCSE